MKRSFFKSLFKKRLDSTLLFCLFCVLGFLAVTMYQRQISYDTEQLKSFRKELKTYTAKVEAAEARNQSMLVEIQDLKTEHKALEEKARFEYKMIQDGEVFVELKTSSD
ncbi:MAG: septum formation initiator family protein [Alcaligenaceae bacterium]|nr:septum formation initiator family protein [Alcaligenaceae bacterium]